MPDARWTILTAVKKDGATRVRTHVYSFATGRWEHYDLEVTAPDGRVKFPSIFFPRALTDTEMEEEARKMLGEDEDD